MYQLVPALEDVGDNDVVRHGTPDGGVEATLKNADGTVWGWQAKYLFRLSSSEISQLDESFRAALSEHPTLTRYVFVMPYNLPSRRPPRGKSAQQRFDDAVERWQELALDQGRSVEIVYVGESRLVDILIRPEQAGRVRYWFDTLLLSTEWLSEKTALVVDAAGPRYTPEVNLDLPVGFALEGLGRTEAFDRTVGRHAKAIRNASWSLSSTDIATSLTKTLHTRIDAVRADIRSFLLEVTEISCHGFARVDWDRLVRRISDIDAALQRLDADVRKRSDALWAKELRVAEASGKPAGRSNAERLERVFSQRVWPLRNALEGLSEFARSQPAQLVNRPRLFLTGAWGTGKTRLLCDAAVRRNAEGRPTVMLLGQQLGASQPWPQLLEQLGVPHLPAEEFLGALDTAAESAGCRALLIIDAVNEGKGTQVWPDNLRAFVSRLSQFPRIGLVMSARDTYVDAILPREAGVSSPSDLGFVVVEHPGFMGEESRATKTYFLYYSLTLPDFPLLVPEFSNPLFLKLLCQTLARQGHTTLPRGGAGFTFLFAQFLTAANERLARADRCDFRATDDLVHRAVSHLAQSMLDNDQEWLTMAEAEKLTTALLPGRGWHSSLLYGLIVEGVLAQNRMADDDIVHFAYQRLADHLRAEQILRTDDPSALNARLKALASDRFLSYRHSGLLEALAVLLPEQRAQELHNLVPHPGFDVIEDAFLASVVWRDISAFPAESNLDYLNSIETGRYWSDDRVVTALLQVACIPGHPFNAEFLHVNLLRRPMPQRDRWWTTFINSSDTESSAVYRIIDWAYADESRAAADDVALLAATALSWFNSASDRRLRDLATKALTNLVRSRVHLVPQLLARFRDVDDPYVLERLYAASYGCALATQDGIALTSLAEAVFREIFASGEPPVHVLLRDYALGVIEKAAEHGALSQSVDLTVARPPYPSPWPLRPPSRASLDRRAGGEEYASLRWSLLEGIKDFENYTVGYRVQHFDAPNQARRRRALRSAARDRSSEALAALEQSLTDSQVELLGGSALEEESAIENLLESLSDQQRRLLSNVQSSDRVLERHLTFPTEEAARWIFARVLSLGWTPARFRRYDEHVGRWANDRGRSRVERIGKKYQWIALHELLARLADHSPFRKWWNDELSRYEGPWQIGARDVDPSLIFEPTNSSFDAPPRTWWAPVGVAIPTQIDHEARAEWIAKLDDIPKLGELLEVDAPSGDRYVALEGHYSWREQVPPQLESLGRVCGNLWIQVRSYLLPRAELDAFLTWADKKDWMGRWMPEGPESHEVFLGEWPWHRAARESARDWTDPASDDSPIPLLPTSASYSWSSEGDDSLANSASAQVPCRMMVDWLQLRWKPRLFEWTDGGNRRVAVDPSGAEEGPRAVLVLTETIRELLDEKELSLVWTVLGEKLVIGDHRSATPRLRLNGVCSLRSGGDEIAVSLLRNELQ